MRPELGHHFMFADSLAPLAATPSAGKVQTTQDVHRMTALSTGQNQLSVAISYSDPLHGKLHHATKFLLVILWFPQFRLPGTSLFWKFQSSVERIKIGQAWPFWIVICFMLLCIIPPNVRPIAEILTELERKCHPSDLVQAYHGKFHGKSSMDSAKIGRVWPLKIAICFMLLCIISPNFRLIPEILKDLEGWCRFLYLVKKPYHGKFQSSMEYAKNGRAWQF